MIRATYITYIISEKVAALGIPQLGVMFPADSTSWIVNETPNLSTVRQTLRVLEQLASDEFLHSLG